MTAHLLSNLEAVSRGLTEMALGMLFRELPDTLAGVVGERQAAILLAKVAASAARRGFTEFLRAAGAGRLEPLEALTVFLRPKGGAPVHPFQHVERIETGGGRAVLVLSSDVGWGLPRAGMMAGVVAGVLEALGLDARPLTGVEAVSQLCRSGGSPVAVYPEGSGARWRIVVDFQACRGGEG